MSGTGFNPRCAGCSYFVQGGCALDDCLLPALEAGAGAMVLSSSTSPVEANYCRKPYAGRDSTSSEGRLL